MARWNLSLATCVAFLLCYVQAGALQSPSKRQTETASGSTCALDNSDLLGEAIQRFNAIIFNDVNVRGSLRVAGPLAVGNDLNSPNVIVNAESSTTCSGDGYYSQDSNGVVVSGTLPPDWAASLGGGHAFLPKDSATDKVTTQAECQVYTNEGTGHFNFEQVQQGALTASARLAKIQTNMRMDANGQVTKLPSSPSNYKVFTFDTCNCNVAASEQLSDPAGIFESNGQWTGPQGWSPAPTDTVVFNIPLSNMQKFTLSTDNPSHGFNGAQTIYNFYPVDQDGNYNQDYKIIVERTGDGLVEGLVLAPRAHVVDGTHGGFAGTFIARDFRGADGSSANHIIGYSAASKFEGCFPSKSDAHIVIPVVTESMAATRTIADAEHTTYIVSHEEKASYAGPPIDLGKHHDLKEKQKRQEDDWKKEGKHWNWEHGTQPKDGNSNWKPQPPQKRQENDCTKEGKHWNWEHGTQPKDDNSNWKPQPPH